MYHLPYNTDLKEFSRLLRKNSTRGEILLWMQLRAGKMMGYQFNRQKPLDEYIVDFYCRRLHLVIEIDGTYHFFPEQRMKDEDRQKILEQLDLNFLRFTERQVKEDMEEVLIEIEHYIRQFEKAFPHLSLFK
jgi:very-short-patch-repair endonuclease